VPHFPGNYPPQNQHECGVSLEDKSALILLTEVITSNKEAVSLRSWELG
jgi:hypothetical protein